MDAADQSPEEWYSVWALPPEHVRGRLRRVMEGLRAAHGGPAFEPHATVVGAIRLRRSRAIEMLRAAAAAGVRPYTARVTGVARGDFFYQCVYLLLEPTPEVVGSSDHFCGQFGYQRSTPYMPHVSILYGDLTDEEEEEEARKKVEELDKDICGLQFEISELALYRTDTEDKNLSHGNWWRCAISRGSDQFSRHGDSAGYLSPSYRIMELYHKKENKRESDLRSLEHVTLDLPVQVLPY